MRKILIICFSLLIAFSVQAKKANLKLKLKKGETYSQHIVSKSTITQMYNGQEMPMEMELSASVSYLVLNKEKEIYTMDVVYDSMSMVMTMPQGSMDFNSNKNDENDILSKVLSKMINQPFQITMNNKGKIIDVKNIENLFTGALEEFPEIPEEQRKQLQLQLEDSYGAVSLKNNLDMATAIYPDNKIKIGEEWTNITLLKSGMNAKMTTTYKYVEKTKNYYVIHGVSEIVNTSTETVEVQGMQTIVELNGTMESDLKVDKKTGWVIESTIIQDLDGNTTIKANEQLPQDMSIPMKIKTEIKMIGK